MFSLTWACFWIVSSTPGSSRFRSTIGECAPPLRESGLTRARVPPWRLQHSNNGVHVKVRKYSNLLVIAPNQRALLDILGVLLAQTGWGIFHVTCVHHHVLVRVFSRNTFFFNYPTGGA